MSYGYKVELTAETDALAAVYVDALRAAGKGFSDVMVAEGGHTPSAQLTVERSGVQSFGLEGDGTEQRVTIKVSLSIGGHVVLPTGGTVAEAAPVAGA